MSAVTLEFIGGPWDGEFRALEAGTQRMFVPFAPAFSLLAPPPEELSRPVPARIGVYERGMWRRRRCTDAGRWIVDRDAMKWMGES